MAEEQSFVCKLHDCIVDGVSTNNVLTLLRGETNLVKEQGWQILTSVIDGIDDIVLTEQGKVNLRAFLDFLVDTGNSKEVIFSLLEVCQAFRSSSLFILVLPCLARTVLRLQLKQLSLDVVLDTVGSHIRGLSGLEDYGLTEAEIEGKTNQLVTSNDAQSSVSLHIDCSEKIVTELVIPVWQWFCSQFTPIQKDMLSDFLMMLFHYPLLYIHIDHESVTNCCVTLLNNYQMLIPTLSTILERQAKRKSTCFTAASIIQEPIKYALVNTTLSPGLGNLCYLSFSKGLSTNFFPNIYTGAYRLSLLLPVLNDLYRLSGNSVVVHKTQELIRSLLVQVSDESLDEDLATLPHLRSCVPFCHWCMQYCDLTPLRRTASELLKLFLLKLTPKCRFLIYGWILETEKNPDVLGYAYTQIKDLIHSTWHDSRQKVGELEKHAVRLISMIYRPPNSENGTGDLLADLSRIGSALNLALYLTLRDKKRSSPYTEDMWRYVREYVEPVGACIQAETEKLQTRLNALSMRRPTSADSPLSEEDSSDPVCSLSVGGETASYTSEMERKAVEAALARLQLVSYNHSVLTEALDSPH